MITSKKDYAYLANKFDRVREIELQKEIGGLWQDIKDAAKLVFIALVIIWSIGGFILWRLP